MTVVIIYTILIPSSLHEIYSHTFGISLTRDLDDIHSYNFLHLCLYFADLNLQHIYYIHHHINFVWSFLIKRF
jgi:hypothetical protein